MTVMSVPTAGRWTVRKRLRNIALPRLGYSPILPFMKVLPVGQPVVFVRGNDHPFLPTVHHIEITQPINGPQFGIHRRVIGDELDPVFTRFNERSDAHRLEIFIDEPTVSGPYRRTVHLDRIKPGPLERIGRGGMGQRP
mgnify:CR=1 FL=1